MKRFLNSLSGRLALLIVTALVVAQAVSLWLFFDERSLAVHAAMGLETAGRAANIARLIEEAPPEAHPSILMAASSPLVRFDLSQTPVVDHVGHDANGAVERRIRDFLSAGPERQIRVELHKLDTDMPAFEERSGTMANMHTTMMGGQMSAVEMRVSVALATGGWLNVDTRVHNPPLQWPWVSMLSFGLTASVILIAAVWFLLAQLTGPLRRLAWAADRLGRGEEVEELPSGGPSEVRELTEAFNNMRERLTRFVADRTRLLGALGHDLRSPLTGLRVRAELVDDDETRERLVATIEEMQEMVDATLSFAKGVETREPTKVVALGDFLQGIGSELSDAGNQVETKFAVNPTVTVRPLLLKRALRNVIENACRYGQSARIGLKMDAESAVITVSDQGQGVPPDMLERIFDPFVRLETSRSRETGGTGLGLSIARTIIRSHGGDITLENAKDAGLIATISLPATHVN